MKIQKAGAGSRANRLTPEQVEWIRKMAATKSMTIAEMAERCGCSRQSIHNVTRGFTHSGGKGTS